MSTRIFKLFFASLGFVAVITEIAVLVSNGTFHPVNFFSYFTIQSNLVFATVLLLSGIVKISQRRLAPYRLASSVYIIVVGIGFSLLLSGLENTAFTAVPWDNVVLHYIMPVVAIVDLMIDRPSFDDSFKRALLWLLYPLLYLIYTLVRGAFTGWYPYPFLDLKRSEVNYVLTSILGILMLSFALTTILYRYANKSDKS